MKPQKPDATPDGDPSPARGIGRGSAIGLSAAALVQLMFADSRRAEAAVATPAPMMEMPASRLRQLEPAQAQSWLRQQLTSNTRAQSFQRAFEQQKYQFIAERAKVYTVGNQTVAILPSYIPAKRTDASHRSVSISISSAGTVAAGALISHSPKFEVTEFTIYDLDDSGALVTGPTISASSLTSAPPEQILLRFRPPAVKPAFATSNLSGASAADLNTISDMFYRQVLADKYASPLYPPAGVTSMLAQIPVIQKFSAVAGAYYARGIDAKLKPTVACTSTSSNACTSCSVIFSIAAQRAQ